jgi:hypothetical protein
MKCRHCGTEIADKALICYRCGEATSTPRIAPPPVRRERGLVPLLIAIAVLIVAAILILPRLEPGAPRLVGWATLVVLTVLSVATLGPRSRTRLRPKAKT